MKNLTGFAHTRNGQGEIFRSKNYMEPENLRPELVALIAELGRRYRRVLNCDEFDEEKYMDFLRWLFRGNHVYAPTDLKASLDRQRVDLSPDALCLAKLQFVRREMAVLQLSRGSDRLKFGIVNVEAIALPSYFDKEEMAVSFSRPRCRKCKQSSEDGEMVWFEADLCSKCASGGRR